MELWRYLLLPDGRLRSGWRVLIFIGLYILGGIISAWLFDGLLGRKLLVYSAAIQLAATLAATWLMLRFFDRQPLLSVGLSPGRSAIRELGYGFGIGFVMVEMVIVFEVATHMVVIESTAAANAAGAGALISVFGILLVAAGSEELLFRGYPFQRLVEGTSGAGAIVITSALFGLLHARNPDATALGVMNTVLAGVLFSVAYLKTRALWLPIGAHFSWNWALAVSGFPVSGLEIVEMPWRAISAAGRVWLYGGNYGPEGGIVATVVLVMGIAFLMIKLEWRASAEEKTSGPTAGVDGPL